MFITGAREGVKGKWALSNLQHCWRSFSIPYLFLLALQPSFDSLRNMFSKALAQLTFRFPNELLFKTLITFRERTHSNFAASEP